MLIDVAALFTWTCGLVVALVVLLRLGGGDLGVTWTDLETWARMTPADVVVGAVLRIAALAGVGLLLLGTLLYSFASLTRAPGALRSVEWLALPIVRRAVQRIAAASLAVTITAGPAAGTATTATASVRAADVPTSAEAGDDRADDPEWWPLDADGTDDKPAQPPEFVPPDMASGGASRGEAADGDPTDAAVTAPPERRTTGSTRIADEYVVRRGDSLWSIAADHVASTGAAGRPGAVSTAEIAEYWLRVVDANAETVRSRDPDLIHPGETVMLP